MEARSLLEHSRNSSTALDRDYTSQVVAKWSNVLEGINDGYQRACLGMLLENELGHIRSLHEETLSTGVGSYTKYLFPILRRVFPNLIANSIVSVQPMSGPVGGVFTYEYKYDDTKGTASSGENLIETFRQWYSSEYIDGESKVTAGNVDGVKVVWSDGTNAIERVPFKWLPIRPHEVVGSEVGDPPTNSYRIVFQWVSGAAAMQQVSNAAGGFTGDGTPANTVVDTTQGTWSLDTTGSVPDNGTAITATYFYDSERIVSTTAPSPGVTGGTYANADQVAKVPEVSLDIQLETVKAISHKLGTNWSSEAVDDLQALHGMAAETELVAGLSNEIGLEFDRNIINDLIQGAQFSASFTHQYGYQQAPNVAGNKTELESIRELISVIDAVGARIHTETKRAPANFIVVPPTVGAMLGQLTSHSDMMSVNQAYQQVQAPSYGPLNSTTGVQRLGTLMNKYAVFQDPLMPTGAGDAQILVGLKGRSFLDAGYVWAPYVPLQVTPTWLDPTNFRFRKGLRTRYAKKMLRREYYGLVNVSGLPTVSLNP
jgi:hypothetical protein